MDKHLQELLDPNPKMKRTDAEEEEEKVGLRAVRLINAVAFPMVLKAALELGVVDTIHAAGDGAFLSPSEIARRLPTEPSNPEAPMLLDRMLRVLASYSILRCRTVRTGEVERVYGAEPICRFLLNDNDQDFGSVAPLFMLVHEDAFVKTWTHLKDVIVEGGDAFSRAHGTRVYNYLNTDKQLSKLFNRAMSKFTTMVMKKILEIYRGFEGVNVLVDVGGGFGTTLGMIIAEYPQIKGINFDLADVLADAPSFQGVEHVAGDMFADIPNGNVILMKWIIHNWTDEDCLKILKNCWKALPDKGKVIIIDIVVPVELEDSEIYSNITFDVDMTMFTHFSGAKERMRGEFEALATDSGFCHCEFICRAYHCWVIEFYKETDASRKTITEGLFFE